MGCTASKLDNEDTVRRCKERRRLMKEIVHSRHHLSAAHSDYCHSLRLTGSTLSSFAAGEPLLSVSDQSPAIIFPPRRPIQSPVMPSHYSPPRQHPRYDKPKLPHILSESSPNSTSNYTPMPRHHSPPPTSHNYSQHVPRHHSPSPSIAPSISSARSFHQDQRRRNGKSKPKLPHILSESSPNSTPRSVTSSGSGFFPIYEANANANYERTPSQASSMWNWENFYPPSPPDSEFFNRKQKIEDDKIKHQEHHNRYDHDIKSESESGTEEEETEREETEREEVQCSEWGDRDHYTETSTTSSDDDYVNDDQRSRSEIGSRSNFGSSAPVQAPKKEETFTQQTKKFPAMSKSDKSDAGSSSFSGGGGGYSESNGDMRIVVRHKDLSEIVAAIRENFDNAATAGDQVSEMLETGRAQLDRSFRQLKKTVYHSSGVLSNLSSSWSSKPPLAVKYRLDTEALVEPGGPRSLCSTLERLLAWEKKLYEEVKAREGVKIEHERKLSTLQNQEYKGGDEAKLDKTKASIKRLQSLIIVTSQAVSTTSTAITGLRDSDLVPQLAEICHGFMYMWRSMNQYHEVQNQIVQQVRGLVNRGTKGESTSDLHRQATRDLESAVSLWHSSFVRLIKYQRDFIQSLHGWLKLTFIPVNNENNHMNREPSELFDFCDEWKLALDRLPDTVASEAIKSFVNVVHVISAKQSEELKIKKRTETVSKELEKKASSLRNIEKKYYHSYSMVGIGIPDTRVENGHMLDARDPLSEKKFELASCQRRVEDEMMRHTKAMEVTRAMTLNNIQTGLPGVFQAMTSFSGLFTEALETVCTRSYAIK